MKSKSIIVGRVVNILSCTMCQGVTSHDVVLSLWWKI